MINACVEQKKVIFVPRKNNMGKHHHFSPSIAKTIQCHRDLSSYSPIPMQNLAKVEPELSVWKYVRIIFAETRAECSCENNRMIQLILFYCIRHEMTHKYQLFSVPSWIYAPRTVFAFEFVCIMLFRRIFVYYDWCDEAYISSWLFSAKKRPKKQKRTRIISSASSDALWNQNKYKNVTIDVSSIWHWIESAAQGY